MTIALKMPPKPWRETPLVESSALSRAADCKIYLKHETLQPSGSFKSRGIGNYLLGRLSSHPNPSTIHFYSSSGGNAGLAAVHAAGSLQRPCTVVVPLSTKPHMIAKLIAAGAYDVLQRGASWKEADTFLREELLSKDPGGVYVPPFDHEDIWAGNSSVIDEISAQFENMEGGQGQVRPDAVICSVGGGGLLCGVVMGMERCGWGDVPVLAMETQGAESLRKSLDARELVTMSAITSQATSLGATRVCERAFELGQRKNVKSVVLCDAEAAMGCWRLADDERVLVEMSCGVNVALCYDGRLEKALGKKLTKDSKVIIVLCGGSNVSVDMINKWREEFGWVEGKMPKHNGVASDYTLANGHA